MVTRELCMSMSSSVCVHSVRISMAIYSFASLVSIG